MAIGERWPILAAAEEVVEAVELGDRKGGQQSQKTDDNTNKESLPGAAPMAGLRPTGDTGLGGASCVELPGEWCFLNPDLEEDSDSEFELPGLPSGKRMLDGAESSAFSEPASSMVSSASCCFESRATSAAVQREEN